MSHLKWKMFVTSMQLDLNKTFLMQYSLMKIPPFSEKKKKAPKVKGCSSLAQPGFVPKPSSLLHTINGQIFQQSQEVCLKQGYTCKKCEMYMQYKTTAIMSLLSSLGKKKKNFGPLLVILTSQRKSALSSLLFEGSCPKQ